ncbi:hypothetical protein ACFL18_01805 [Patescibacteria group bacterium]
MKCPLCQHQTRITMMDDEKTVQCPSCGAHKDLSQVSGNVIWMRNGRVVLAEEDVKEQIKKHNLRYPKSKIKLPKSSPYSKKPSIAKHKKAM